MREASESDRVPVAICLGANLGDRERALSAAHRALVDEGWVTAARASSIYETAPIGPPQPAFLNRVLVGTTHASPHRLLEAVRSIEDRLGRARSGVRWGPREIDIDLLMVGEGELRSDDLILPHPELGRRRFVLVPWAELEPDRRVPGTERTVEQLLTGLEAGGDRTLVERWVPVRVTGGTGEG